jgi:hypothetical protein
MQDAIEQKAEHGKNVFFKRRSLPIFVTAKWVASNLGVIVPGANLAGGYENMHSTDGVSPPPPPRSARLYVHSP